MFTAVAFIRPKEWISKAVYQPVNGQRKYTNWNITLFFFKKKQPERNIVICYNMMKVEDIMLNEISQAQEDKYCVSYSYIKAWKE